MANDLGIPQLADGQSRPDITANDATDALGDAVANKFDCDLASGNVSVTTNQYRRSVLFRAINVATAGRTVTLPQNEREFVLVECDTGNTDPVSLIRGSTTIVMQPGRLYLVRTDGTANGLVARDVGGVNEPNDIAVFLPGAMTNAQICLRYKATRAFSLPTNLVGSYLNAGTAANADTTITFKKNGSSIGTALVSAAGTVGAFTVTATSFVAGDLLSIHGQATADTTIADIAIGLKGTR